MRSPIIETDVEQILSSNLINWKRFYKKTILITGANGMLPAYLVYTFLELNKRSSEADIHILALVRNQEKADHKFREYLGDKHLEFLVQDVSAPIEYTGKIDFVFHAASQASPKFYGVDPVGTINANVQGTINTLQLAVKNNVEGYLYISSGEVYGVTDTSKSITETDYGYVDINNVRSCYAEGKRMGEVLCVAYHTQFKISTQIVRVFHTYGPGLQLNDGRVFGDFAKSIVQNQDIVLHSDGSAIRPFCYISDATIAFCKIILDGDNKPYNMANMECETSMLNLAHILVNLYPEKHLKVIINDQSQSETSKMKSPLSRLKADCTRLQSIGWHPQVGLIDGFRRTINNFIYE